MSYCNSLLGSNKLLSFLMLHPGLSIPAVVTCWLTPLPLENTGSAPALINILTRSRHLGDVRLEELPLFPTAGNSLGRCHKGRDGN